MTIWNRFPYEIRWAGPDDWAETMDMIWRTFLRFEAQDYTEEGVSNFRDFITDDRLYDMFLNGNYPMMVALDQEKIIGQISVRNGNHISLLFVEEAYHNKGIGRELVKRMAAYLKKDRKALFMTVQAAPYAVGFYRKVGFRASSPEEEYSGIRVTSMEKFL